ncbi:MAG: YaiI/YqxD family protein [Geminicoccaceae bacterium]|nr:YaiI/YqxD family protein [Geminicoccaceae bacterium]
MTRLLIDGDGCPVKDECYRVADRLGLQVIVVANHWLRVPQAPRYSLIVVESGLDVADDRLVEEAKAGDVVVTADIPLASRVVGRGALAVTPKGRLLDAGTVGAVKSDRDLMTALREAGEIRGGGRPFTKADRSAFLQGLDRALGFARRLS